MFDVIFHTNAGSFSERVMASEIPTLLDHRALSQYKQSDAWHDQQVVIVIQPAPESDIAAAKVGIKAAMISLEQTGLS